MLQFIRTRNKSLAVARVE